ncbi:hypothetical protein [Vaginella massiliensis]|nr:hypothetical protein [Vaginella massiliensis]
MIFESILLVVLTYLHHSNVDVNDEIFSPEEKQGALDFFFGKNE